jgi:putative FmdB family regulatory protein
MPTYEYKCDNGHQFEEFQNIRDEPIRVCKKEGCTADVKRLLGAGGAVIFKGSGFFCTDYKNKK